MSTALRAAVCSPTPHASAAYLRTVGGHDDRACPTPRVGGHCRDAFDCGQRTAPVRFAGGPIRPRLGALLSRPAAQAVRDAAAPARASRYDTPPRTDRGRGSRHGAADLHELSGLERSAFDCRVDAERGEHCRGNRRRATDVRRHRQRPQCLRLERLAKADRDGTRRHDTACPAASGAGLRRAGAGRREPGRDGGLV